MKLLLQAGIHLIKKVITFVIYGRSVQVFKACTLLYFFSAEFFFSQIFLRGEGFVPQISQILHRFSSSWFFFIGFHGWIGRHSCLPDYSRNFAEFWPLANGSRPIYAPVVFCHADFADDADFSSLEGFVPQISQIYTDFLWNLWWISLSSLRGYLQRPNRSPLRKSVSNRLSSQPPNKFREIRWIKNPMRKNLRHLRNLRD